MAQPAAGGCVNVYLTDWRGDEQQIRKDLPENELWHWVAYDEIREAADKAGVEALIVDEDGNERTLQDYDQ